MGLTPRQGRGHSKENGEGRTPLAEADILRRVARGDLEGLRQALGAGADAGAKDRFGVSALARAAAKGDLDAANLLLDHGADPNETSEVGNSPLMMAAAQGRLEMVQLLLERGADPDSKNKWGIGAADWAAWPPNAAEIKALLQG